MNLVTIGSIAFDSIETPFGKKENTLGGSATYFSLAASYFTTPGLVAVVGEDFDQNNILTLSEKGVDTQGLQKIPGKTFRWGGIYGFDLNSRTTLFTELNVLEQFQPALPESYKDAKFIFLGNIHPALQKQVISQVHKPLFIGLDTMNFWIEQNLTELKQVLPMVDMLSINDSEARELAKESNIHTAAKSILAMMQPAHAAENVFPTLIIKRGEYGVLAFQNDNIFNLPAYPLENVVDPTGAGDSFAGGFMGYLAASHDTSWENIKKACVAGTVLASFCVEKMGVDGLLGITEEKIQDRLKKLKDVTLFQ